MRALGERIVVNMLGENNKSRIIQTLDGSARPQSVYGVVEHIGPQVTDIKVGDIIVAPIVTGQPLIINGTTYKIMLAKDAQLVFEESEMDIVKSIKSL